MFIPYTLVGKTSQYSSSCPKSFNFTHDFSYWNRLKPPFTIRTFPASHLWLPKGNWAPPQAQADVWPVSCSALSPWSPPPVPRAAACAPVSHGAGRLGERKRRLIAGKQNQTKLVGGWPPLWKIWKSAGMIIPNIWKKNMFQTTNQYKFLNGLNAGCSEIFQCLFEGNNYNWLRRDLNSLVIA